MRFVKRLQLHGYKTFAARTDFAFDAGITAIVGPNGSGKSNIADGLRWVLGEQSYGTLRGKRTEDMIFSGSEQRARLGMAHVSVTFDNSTGWLPIEFSEVEVARRAYRSGENEYFLNGNRVRLRDITELLGSSGLSERTYSVIGQGLIDQALSQRPEERRKLFEEAAGITVYQSKREQAAQRLVEARANLTRAQDIVSELTPRLRYLKGQARRASEYQQIKADLAEQLQIWYGYKWRETVAGLGVARERLAQAEGSAEDQAATLNRLLEQVAARRAERAGLRDELGDWHRASSRLHQEAESVQRELAVRSEQSRLWGEQREDLERDLMHLRAAFEDGAERLRAAEAELAEAQAAHEARAAGVAGAQQELGVREGARRMHAQRVAESEEAGLALRTRLADRSSRLAQVGERRAELAETRSEEARAVETAAAGLAAVESQLAALAERIAASEAELAQVEKARQAQGADQAAAQQAEREAAERLSAAQRGLARLQDQQELLTRLRDEGAGLNAGARSVLSARGQLQGIVGALGDLIEVPPELERAIEAALGGRLQDIVVRRWEHAESAVEYLKRSQGGRATFLPLDSLRPGRPVETPRAAGVLGVASNLVKFDPEIRAAVELALNHIVVVENLPTARRLLSSEGRATLVTVEGEIVRSSGSVTGGAEGNRRDSGVLSRARALRELPQQIAAAAERVKAQEAQVAQARKDQEAARQAIADLRSRRDALAAAAGRLGGERGQLQIAADRARQSRTWHTDRGRQVEKDLGALANQEAELKTAVAALREQLAGQEAVLASARRELAASATDDLVADLARLRAEAAVSAGLRQSRQARVAELQALQQQRTADIAAKAQRSAALADQLLVAERVVREQGAAAEALAVQIAALAAQIDPAEARLAQLEQEQRDAESGERTLREALRVAQSRQSQGELAVQRAHDEIAHLRSEIEKELGLVSLEGEKVAEEQPPLPMNGMVTHVAAIEVLPEGLDQDVRALRAQLARLGPVNLEALEEYNEVEARYNFLTSQSADLTRAAASLEEIIADLDKVMESEFVKTFKAVAAQFRDEFAGLFGGGAARLTLTDPDSPSTSGVEIVARPPGKREQGLALLSGGERALTAAALIFSILKVRPTPFCVLDEVDAALDEANVGRFREALKALSSQTQFILITHNRGTIEAADTIYGISMGADHTSQMLSLRLDGQEIVPLRPEDMG